MSAKSISTLVITANTHRSWQMSADKFQRRMIHPETRRTFGDEPQVAAVLGREQRDVRIRRNRRMAENSERNKRIVLRLNQQRGNPYAGEKILRRLRAVVVGRAFESERG